jgi:hypothetical protein
MRKWKMKTYGFFHMPPIRLANLCWLKYYRSFGKDEKITNKAERHYDSVVSSYSAQFFIR